MRWAGCVRKVWNYFLGEVKKSEDRYKAKLKAESEQAKDDAEKTQDTSSSNKETDNKEAKTKVQDKLKAKPKKKNRSYKGYHHYASRLTRLKAKKKYAYLNDCPAQALQQTLINLDKGFKRFFKKEAGHPI